MMRETPPKGDNAKAQASYQRSCSVIAAHLVFTLYGHWAVNDPRGSGSSAFIDDKFEMLGPIHHGRKSAHAQPTPEELRSFHHKHSELLNFRTIWIDDLKRKEIAIAIEEVIKTQRYTCYACAICANHLHLIIRTHRDKANTMWDNIAENIKHRLRHRFPDEVCANHPVISARPYKVFLKSTEDVWRCIKYIDANPTKEGLEQQHWPFVTPYNNWPNHKKHE